MYLGLEMVASQAPVVAVDILGVIRCVSANGCVEVMVVVVEYLENH